MAYRIAGRYLAVCDCSLICPCPVDGTPTGPNNECKGVTVFGVAGGNLDGADLGGTSFALYNFFPSNLTSGDWKVGIVVDTGASDEQAQAIERIVSGQEGGPFGEFVPLIGEYLGMERAPISLGSDSVSIGGRSDFSVEPLMAPDGSPTTVRGAMFAFAPEYTIGKGTGSSSAFGLGFEAKYAESAQFEFSSEMAGEVHPRA